MKSEFAEGDLITSYGFLGVYSFIRMEKNSTVVKIIGGDQNTNFPISEFSRFRFSPEKEISNMVATRIKYGL
jgi:hypothetical protein